MTLPPRPVQQCPEPGCRWNEGHHGGIHQDPVKVAERITLAASPPVKIR